MIYLVSTSPRRRKILKDLGIRFKVLSPDYKEKPLPGLTVSKLVRAHALGKALSAVPLVRQGKILSADTVVYFKGKIIGKPRHKKNAVSILTALQGRWHQVYTGVALVVVRDRKVARQSVLIEKTRVRLKSMTAADILSYFKVVNPLDKAGAYAIQAARNPIVAEVRGSFSNAVGLPVEKLKKMRFL